MLQAGYGAGPAPSQSWLSHDAALHSGRAGGENPGSCPPPRQACASCKQQVWPDSAANIHLCLHGTASTCLLPAQRRVLRQEAGNRQRSSLPTPSTTTDSPEKNGEEGGAGRRAGRGCKVPREGRGGEPACVCPPARWDGDLASLLPAARVVQRAARRQREDPPAPWG